jgi:hypothetical protein
MPMHKITSLDIFEIILWSFFKIKVPYWLKNNLRIIYISDIFAQNATKSYVIAVKWLLLALATLGDMAQIGLALFVSHSLPLFLSWLP